MLIGIVVGNVWATRKEDSLNGLKLMVVQRLDLAHNKLAESFVAVDCVGAGIGERGTRERGEDQNDSDTAPDAWIAKTLCVHRDSP